MPWKDLSPVQQRKAFIDEYLKQQDSVSELCRRFAVSRKTAYKWIQRFLAGCDLVDRSRRPHSSPTATAAAFAEAVVGARKDRRRRLGGSRRRGGTRQTAGSSWRTRCAEGPSPAGARVRRNGCSGPSGMGAAGLTEAGEGAGFSCAERWAVGGAGLARRRLAEEPRWRRARGPVGAFARVMAAHC